MKKIVSMILVVVCFMSVISFSGCAGKKLDTPKNVKCTDEGLITWTSVKNATSYDVTLNNEVYNVTTTSYQVSSTVNDFMYSIVAKAAGYKDSDPTLTYTFKGTGIVTPLPENLTVKINGSFIRGFNVDNEFIRKIRASYYLIGALFIDTILALKPGTNPYDGFIFSDFFSKNYESYREILSLGEEELNRSIYDYMLSKNHFIYKVLQILGFTSLFMFTNMLFKKRKLSKTIGILTLLGIIFSIFVVRYVINLEWN